MVLKVILSSLFLFSQLKEEKQYSKLKVTLSNTLASLAIENESKTPSAFPFSFNDLRDLNWVLQYEKNPEVKEEKINSFFDTFFAELKTEEKNKLAYLEEYLKKLTTPMVLQDKTRETRAALLENIFHLLLFIGLTLFLFWFVYHFLINFAIQNFI